MRFAVSAMPAAVGRGKLGLPMRKKGTRQGIVEAWQVVFEALCRVVIKRRHEIIADTMAVVERELTSVTGSHVRIRRLVG
jgi:hypothetical protein